MSSDRPPGPQLTVPVRRPRRPARERAAHLLAYWLWVGFAGGAGVLLLLATPLEHWLKSSGTDQTRINLALGMVAAAWIGAAGWLASLIGRWASHGARRWIAHALGLAACAAVFVAFLQSGRGVMASFQGSAEAIGPRFTFGPYPDADRMRQLKADGFTGVISLLSPLVPFEAVLLTNERRAAAETGLDLVEASMLPWISENRASLDRIRTLVAQPTGRYYVHCYLGRHRADVARAAIEEALGQETGLRLATRLPARFSRGALVRVGDHVVLGPRPTKDEWFPPLVQAGIRRVVALDTENADMIAEERAWASSSGVTLEVFEAARGYGTLAEDLAKTTEPTYVHAFRPDQRTAALLTVLEALMPGSVRRMADAAGEDVPAATGHAAPLAPVSLPSSLERGRITRVGGIAIGPLPTPGEWEDVIGPSGLRYVISLLDPANAAESPWIAQERAMADLIGLKLALLPVRGLHDIWPAVRAARRLGSGVYLHGWADEERVQLAAGILGTAYPVPTRLERGPVTTVADGVYAGPMPTPDDWFGGLARAGVVTVICLLDSANAEEAPWIPEVQEIAASVGATVVVNPPPGSLPPATGRTYIHGFGADDPRLAAYLGRLRR